MADIFRDSPTGQFIRWVTNNRVLRYPEELPGFVLPSSIDEKSVVEQKQDDASGPPTNERGTAAVVSQDVESQNASTLNVDLERSPTAQSAWSGSAPAAAGTNPATSAPIHPVVTSDGITLVDWYSTTDSSNPYNWSLFKRVFVSAQILYYTFVVYMGSSLFIPSIGGIIQEFGVSETAATLGVALYVVGYGIGPMLFSPLSEVPAIGRTPPYIITYILFVAICFPAALTPTFAGILVSRFLLGFFGSPCLATGPASLLDMFSMIKFPYVLNTWAAAASFGPAMGPVIGGFTVRSLNWRWTSWELLWLTGPSLLLMLVALPETSSSTILLKRAARLRKVLDNEKIKSQSELDQQKMTYGQICREALLVPWQINFYDPAVAFTTVYVALVYAIFYSFFESIPFVFPVIYGFDVAQSGLTFLSIFAALILTITAYNIWAYQTIEKPFPTSGFGSPESRLTPGLYASFMVPMALFTFAWTARESVHWIVPTIAMGVTVASIYVIMQSIFLYLPFNYPQHTSSLFAANDLARSLLAAAALLFSRPMFIHLGIGGGVSLLGGLTILCIAGIFTLYWWGDKMRARSSFAMH